MSCECGRVRRRRACGSCCGGCARVSRVSIGAAAVSPPGCRLRLKKVSDVVLDGCSAALRLAPRAAASSSPVFPFCIKERFPARVRPWAELPSARRGAGRQPSRLLVKKEKARYPRGRPACLRRNLLKGQGPFLLKCQIKNCTTNIQSRPHSNQMVASVGGAGSIVSASVMPLARLRLFITSRPGGVLLPRVRRTCYL